MKRCSKCGVEKAVEDFNWKKKNQQRSSQCKVCHKMYTQEHYKKNRQLYIDRAKARHTPENQHKWRLSKYGVSEERFCIMLAKYNGMCWLCQVQPGQVIDHDHKCCSGNGSCGVCVRGILCHECNLGLGKLKDSPDLLRNALSYLGV